MFSDIIGHIMSDNEREEKFISQESKRLVPQFRKICDSYGLEDQDATLIDSVLNEFSSHPAGIFDKLRRMHKRAVDNPRKEDIMAAFTGISHASMERDPFNPIGRLVRKYPLN